MKKIKKSLLKVNEINSPDLWERIDNEIYTQEREDLIVAKSQKTLKKFSVKKLVAVCACLALLCSIPVAAVQVKNYFDELYNNTEDLEEGIFDCAYTDQNKHLKISVEQILSDSVTVSAIVSIQALDDKGQEIVNSYTEYYNNGCIDLLKNPPPIDIQPIFIDNNIMLCPSFGVDRANLLEDLSTNDTKYFVISYNRCSDDNITTDSIQFKYILQENEEITEEWHDIFTSYNLYSKEFFTTFLDERNNTASLDEISNTVKLASIPITNSIEFETYSIDGVQVPNKNYIPAQIKISPLTIMIYGYDLRQDISFNTEPPDEISIKFKDGSSKEIFYYSAFNPVYNNKDSNNYFCICTCSINILNEPNEPIDLTNITGIEIDGVYYELK